MCAYARHDDFFFWKHMIADAVAVIGTMVRFLSKFLRPLRDVDHLVLKQRTWYLGEFFFIFFLYFLVDNFIVL
jgi:hypothetical protein